MEQDETIAEDGEIFDDDSDNKYVPLERPTNYSTTSSTDRFNIQQQQQPVQLDTESEDDLITESDSDSDSDCMIYKVKKPKIKLKRPKLQRTENPRRKKYDIWSTRVQEEVLAATLNSCDVSYRDRSRDVESYDYTIAQKLYGGGDNTSNKRSRGDRNNPNLRLRKRSSSNERSDANNPPRHIFDLAVTCDNTTEEIARDLANKLYEEKEDLLQRIVDTAGKTKALEVFKKTQRIEAEGGLMIMCRTRRRTPGGVFLFLMRNDPDLTREQLGKMFKPKQQPAYKESVKLKKQKRLDEMKKKNALSNSNKDLPDLLTRAELCVQKLANENNRTRKESLNIDVINPPPTPETDCHENSCDGMDQPVNDDSGRTLQNYEVDFLDIGNTDTMDLF